MSLFSFGKPNVGKMIATNDARGLRKALNHKDPAIYLHAAEGLVLLRDSQGVAAIGRIGEEGVELLLRALWNDEVKSAAIEALVEIGGSKVVEGLLRNASSSKRLVVEALARMGQPALPRMLAALRDYEFEVRRAAAEVLDRLGWKPADDEDHAWYLAAKASWDMFYESSEWAQVRELGPKAANVLITILRDWHHRPREAGYLSWKSAESALAKAEWQLESEADRAWQLMARHDWEKCITLGGVAVEPLIAFLRDEEEGPSKEKDAARDALLTMGNAAVEPLLALLTKPEVSERKEAIRMLGEIRDQRAVEPVIAALRDSVAEVRWEAAGALGKFGDKRAVPALKAALLAESGTGHISREVRNTITASLSLLGASSY